MKKVLALIMALSMAVACSACGVNESKEQSSENSFTNATTSVETTAEPTVEITTEQATTSSLSEDDFIKNIASDFSTEDAKFTYNKSSDTFYMLDCNNDDIDVDISLSKVGDKITVDYIDVIFATDSTDDICYKTLVRMLKSDVFGFSTSEQMDILLSYKKGEITFDNGDVEISEAQKENIRVISFNF